MKGKLSIFCSSLTIFTLICSYITPWFWIQKDNEETEFCFIDGTCRKGGLVSKSNGESQKIYDITLSLMVLVLIPFIIMVHMIYFMYSKRYENSSWFRPTAITTGFITFLLIFGAVLTFSVGIPATSPYDNFFDERTDPDGHKIKWGGYAGWFFAIFTILFMLPTLWFALVMKNKRKRILIDTTKEVLLGREYGTSSTTITATATH